jgi:hypothetical protein
VRCAFLAGLMRVACHSRPRGERTGGAAECGTRATAWSSRRPHRHFRRSYVDPRLLLRERGYYVDAEGDRAQLPDGGDRARSDCVVAEALSNVAKYAQASSAEVRIGELSASVTVEVSDDGVGGADPEHGSGLSGLADRVASLDGRLEVDSPAGRGTTVRAKIPCA